MTPEDYEKMSTAKMSQVVLDNLSPVNRQQRELIITRMMMSYRSGEYTPELLSSSVAQLCALEDIELALKSKVRAGQKIMEDQHVR
jgi:hypothetical protein